MKDQDEKQLNSILNALKTLQNYDLNKPKDYDNVLTILKNISEAVNKMIPWKIGSVKDTYCSELWKSLEYLSQFLNNPSYKDIVKIMLPYIVKDLNSLDGFIKVIFDQENELAKMKEEAQTEPRKKLKEQMDSKKSDFNYICAIMKFYLEELNLNTMVLYLKNIVDNAELIKQDNNYLPAFIRVFEVLGEASKQFSPNTKMKQPICWSIIEKLRDSFAHNVDKDQEILREKIDKLLSAQPKSAEKLLIDNILANDLIYLFKYIDYLLQQKHIPLRVNANDFSKNIDNNINQNTSSIQNEDLQNYPNLYLLEKYLSSNANNIKLKSNQVELVKVKALSKKASNSNTESSIDNAINMITLILQRIIILENFISNAKTSNKITDIQKLFEKIPLARYVLEHEAGHIGEICKKLRNSTAFKTHAFDKLNEVIETIDSARDKLLHHQHDIDDDAMSENTNYLIAVGQVLKIVQTKLELTNLTDSINHKSQNYQSLITKQATEKDLRSSAAPGEFLAQLTWMDGFIKECSTLDGFNTKNLPKILSESKIAVDQYYKDEKAQYTQEFTDYISEINAKKLVLESLLESFKKNVSNNKGAPVFNTNELLQFCEQAIQTCGNEAKSAQQELETIIKLIDNNCAIFSGKNTTMLNTISAKLKELQASTSNTNSNANKYKNTNNP